MKNTFLLFIIFIVGIHGPAKAQNSVPMEENYYAPYFVPQKMEYSYLSVSWVKPRGIYNRKPKASVGNDLKDPFLSKDGVGASSGFKLSFGRRTQIPYEKLSKIQYLTGSYSYGIETGSLGKTGFSKIHSDIEDKRLWMVSIEGGAGLTYELPGKAVLEFNFELAIPVIMTSPEIDLKNNYDYYWGYGGGLNSDSFEEYYQVEKDILGRRKIRLAQNYQFAVRRDDWKFFIEFYRYRFVSDYVYTHDQYWVNGIDKEDEFTTNLKIKTINIGFSYLLNFDFWKE